ncbi:hypothetical protein SLE2022_137580 [Rubroshorea leprosula]
MDLVGSIIEIVKCVGGPIVRYLKQQIKFNDSMEKFKRRKDELRSRRCDIESKLSTERRYGKVPRGEVQRWLNDAEEFIARPEVEDEVNGWGCLSCCCRVKILEGRVQQFNEVYGRGDRFAGECLVIDDPSALAVELRTSELQGNEAVKGQILACLKGEEVTMLGVWGMGGVGKTTIMKHVYNGLLTAGKFKKIIWATVSQNSDTYNLQEQIACSLQEELEKHQNTTNRASMLSKMLEKQKPYLLILDDVWSSFKLEEVGIPEPDVTNGCKLALTTRSQEVSRSMGCEGIKVSTLPQEEALKLFLDKVGDTVLSDHGGGIKKDLESTLKAVVDECDGLPLALITVAGSLKGISESRLWSVALNQLRDCKRNVAGTDVDAFRILKFSYDRLENQQIKYCFLYCALYPEDHKILEKEIIENWIDEGFIDEMESRQSMKDEGYGILRKLEDNSLLELIKDEIFGDCVRMHDLIRDMALDITRTSPRFLVEAGKSLTELPEKVKCTEDVEKVSVMFNEIEVIPSSMASSTCTRLATLLLAHNDLFTIPESVFEHMPELKILDLSFNYRLWSLPNSVSKLVKLTTLLLKSTALEKVPSLSGLGSLTKLDLGNTKIKEVPEGLGMLKNLKCLFLFGYNLEIDEIADGVLSNLSKLQELRVACSGIELKGDVVGRLKKLEVFCGCFPTANDMRIFLKCQPNRLSTYFIIVGSKRDEIYGIDEATEELPRYEKIMVLNETSIVGENMLIPSVQVLCIDSCHDITSLNDFSGIKDATDLRECWIRNCDGMECVLSSWINSVVVQSLEYLLLYNLHKLDGLFEANVMATSPPPPGAFSSLKEVWITKCKKIKKLFPSWKLVEYLQSLEEICVEDCEEMEEIIGSDPEEEGEEGGDSIKELILPKLKKLMFRELLALRSICSRRAVMVSDSLKDIEITDCKGLRRIPFRLFPHLSLDGLDNLDWVFDVELIAMSPPQPCTFLSLKRIEIQKCRRVKKLFPSWKLVEYLQNLKQIDVGYCEEMEEIIASDPEEEGEGGDIIKELILPKLKYLSLWHLPALKSICSRRVVMVCDSLESISISDYKVRIPFHLPPYLSLDGLDNLDWLFEVELIAMSPPQPRPFSFLKNVRIFSCKKLKKLFPSWKLVEYLQNLEEIVVRYCEEMEEIIASDPEGGGEEGGNIIKELILPKFKSLYLYNLPALKSICSRRAVMVSDCLENIHISNCKALRRIPFRLPPRLHLFELDNLDWVFEVELIAMSPPQPRTFSFLKEVVIMSCKEIKKLFPSWKLVEYLQSLEEICVKNCEEMEEIIGSDPEEEGEEGGDIIKKLILPKLNTLKLQGLPKLKRICSRRVIMVCDSFKDILIRDCKGLRRIPFHLLARLTLSELDNLDWLFEVELISMSPPQPSTFSSLKEIKIGNCSRAKKLFPSWKLVEYLQSLKEIYVYRCEEMEEIIGSDPKEEGEGGDIIKKLILPKSKRLRLERLPTLKSICSRRAVLVCDFLESITIEDCKGLRRIPLSLPLVDNVQPSPPPSLKKIYMRRREEEWWESLEWDHPNAKDVLQPMVRFFPDISPFPSSESEQSESADYPQD